MSGAADLTDEQLLSGLWWNDPEWPAWTGPLWTDYVERMHAWNDYRKSVANVLRTAKADPASVCSDCDGFRMQRTGWGPGQQGERPCITCNGTGRAPDVE